MHISKLFPEAVVSALLGVAGIAPAIAAMPPPPNTGVSIWTGNVTAFRRKHGAIGGYKKRWDLSALPRYVPRRQLSGTLRIWGLSYLQDGPLGEYWAEAFQKYLEIDPNGPMAQTAKDMLASIGAKVETNYGKPKATKKN